MVRLRILCGVCVGLVGCVGEHEVRPDYAAYLLAQQNIAAEQAAQRAALERDLTASAARCTTDACSIAVAGFRALALSGGGGGQVAVQIAQPQPERNGWDRAVALMSAISPILGYAVQWRSIEESNKTTRTLSQTNAEVQIATANAWSGVVKEVAAVPSFYVGGDYQSVGGDLTGRDKSGRDHIDNAGLYNTGDGNRFNSPDVGGPVYGCIGGSAAPGGAGGPGGAVGDGSNGNVGSAGNGAASGRAGDAGCVGGSAGG